jgi:hypothetical protein
MVQFIITTKSMTNEGIKIFFLNSIYKYHGLQLYIVWIVDLNSYPQFGKDYSRF